jgi:hypothetical protein
VITRFAMPYFGCSFRNAAAAQGDRVEVVEVLALDAGSATTSLVE